MDRGSYVAASAGQANIIKMEIVNNNLANVNTVGFKKQILLGDVQTFDETLASKISGNHPTAEDDHNRNPGVSKLRTATDFSPGGIQFTGNDLDIALRRANQFLVIDQDGEELYTRAGNLTLQADGTISTLDGHPVLGGGGPVAVANGRVTIDSAGRVLGDTGVGIPIEAGRLRVVEIENTEDLERVQGARFRLKGNSNAMPVAEPEVEPRSLEMSNVSAIQSVVDLITASRGFELYAKSAKSIDELNQLSIQQIGKRT